MKRLWTLDDIKGFIKRYAEPKGKSDEIIKWVEGYAVTKGEVNSLIKTSTSKNVYKISWALAQTGTSTVDGRFCQSCDAYVNYATWNSFMLMSLNGGIVNLAKWMSQHTDVSWTVNGLLAEGTPILPMVAFPNEGATDITLGCIKMDTYKYTTVDALTYYDTVYFGMSNGPIQG